MSKQIPVDRVSLKISLEERYKTQTCGGAYNAKSVETTQGNRMPIFSSDGMGSAITEVKWTNKNFLVKEGVMQTDLKNSALNYIDGLGFSRTKYKP